jgi:NTE family protein
MLEGIMDRKKVAIACQGGGSHTAFTAGVLKHLLLNAGPQFEFTGFSGTSGGALCASLAWYGLISGSPQKSAKLLDGFWKDNSATAPWEAYLNLVGVYLVRLKPFTGIPEVSPYASWLPWLPSTSEIAQTQLERLIKKHIDFDKASDLIRQPCPKLFIGAIDVLKGSFDVFDETRFSSKALLASAAMPFLFPAVPVSGSYYWDGLFSHNPPIRAFLRDRSVNRKPDEIWIVQVNPQDRESLPKNTEDIFDRRNELAGNLSLNQEIEFIETINDILTSSNGVSSLKKRYKHVDIKPPIELDLNLDYASKLDRDPGFIHMLMDLGEKKAATFLETV